MKDKSIEQITVKNVRLGIRIEKELKDSWKAQCKKKEISLTNFIISSVEKRMQDNERRKVLAFIEKQDNIFAKVENNINQLAKYVNTQKHMSDTNLAYFNKVLDEIMDLKFRQNEIIHKIYSLLGK